MLAVYELRQLRGNEARRERIVFLVSFGLAGLFGLLLVLQVEVPNPTRWVERIFGPVGRMIVSR